MMEVEPTIELELHPDDESKYYYLDVPALPQIGQQIVLNSKIYSVRQVIFYANTNKKTDLTKLDVIAVELELTRVL